MRAAIAVPCYNEAKRLEPEMFRAYLAVRPDVCFFFVDDGSRDATLEVLEKLRAGHEDRIWVFRQPKNAGKAEAVRRGMNEALALGFPLTGFWDADLATPLETIGSFLDLLARRPEIEMVFGARVQLLGREIRRLPVRHYLGRVFATTVSNILRLAIYDTQCGAKIFRATPMLRQGLEQPFLSRWVFDVEMLARFLVYLRKDPKALAGLIYEYPLEKWVDVAGSRVKPTDFFKAFRDVWRIWRTYLL